MIIHYYQVLFNILINIYRIYIYILYSYPSYNKKSDVVVEKLFHYLDFIYVFFNTISHYGEFQLTKDLLIDEYNFLTKPAHIEVYYYIKYYF